MGQYDSSKTRVVPVFDALMGADPSGTSWLHRLLLLGSRAAPEKLPSTCGRLRDGHPWWWGCRERRLPAPQDLLVWLVHNVTSTAVAKSRSSGRALTKRESVARRDSAAIEEALAGIRSGARGSEWFIFEGPSAPDAFLETPQLVLVVEGKRTERTTTTSTTWMERRSQLLRQMDAASEIADGRAVLGLLIVEGRHPDVMSVPSDWAQACAADLEPEMVNASLPHRTEAERRKIADGVLGAVTWQRVCREFDLPWPPAPDGFG